MDKIFICQDCELKCQFKEAEVNTWTGVLHAEHEKREAEEVESSALRDTGTEGGRV